MCFFLHNPSVDWAFFFGAKVLKCLLAHHRGAGVSKKGNLAHVVDSQGVLLNMLPKVTVRHVLGIDLT